MGYKRSAGPGSPTPAKEHIFPRKCHIGRVPLLAAIFFVLVLLGGGNPGRAAPVSCPAEELSKLSNTLLDWIGAHADYDVERVRGDPPNIESCASGDIIHLSGNEVLVDGELLAAYDPLRRVIYLVDPWDPKAVVDQSRLLHELVHDVQSLNRAWTCPREQEWEAYKLQEAWLKEHGIDPHFNWAQILILSRCRPSVHE